MASTDELLAAGMLRQFQHYRTALAAGMPRVGWKLGVTAAAAQERMGLHGPLLGWLDGRQVFSDRSTYRPPQGSLPRLEAEVAVSLNADVGADVTHATARAAIAEVAPAFEIVDGSKPTAPLDEMVANDVLHAAVVFGSGVAPRFAPGLAAAGLPKVWLNGEQRATGAPGRVPDDLADAVVYAARTLAAHGERLRAGDRIICGTYIDPFPLAAGDLVEADFGPLGRLEVRIGG